MKRRFQTFFWENKEDETLTFSVRRIACKMAGLTQIPASWTYFQCRPNRFVQIPLEPTEFYNITAPSGKKEFKATFHFGDALKKIKTEKKEFIDFMI